MDSAIGETHQLCASRSLSPPLPARCRCTAGSLRSFTAIKKDAGLCCGSRLRKGEVFAYIGRNQNLKDLKAARASSWLSFRSSPLERCAPAGLDGPRHTIMEGRYKATWKREFKLLWRRAGLLISMIKWTRTSRLSIKISLSKERQDVPGPRSRSRPSRSSTHHRASTLWQGGVMVPGAAPDSKWPRQKRPFRMLMSKMFCQAHRCQDPLLPSPVLIYRRPVA